MNRPGFIELKTGEATRSYRLALGELEEFEATLDMSIFVAFAALTADIPFLKQEQWREIIRLGLIGGGMDRVAAAETVAQMLDEHGPQECLKVATLVLAASLRLPHGTETPPGKTMEPTANASTSAPSGEAPKSWASRMWAAFR